MNPENEWFDTSLYPDVDPPETLSTLADQVDFLVRLCSAWDFGILPRITTVDEIRHASWREAVECCRLLTSPMYHLLREWHNLEQPPYLGQQLGYIRDDPYLEYV